MDNWKNKERVNHACADCLDTEFMYFLIITKNLINIFKRRDMVQFF